MPEKDTDSSVEKMLDWDDKLDKLRSKALKKKAEKPRGESQESVFSDIREKFKSKTPKEKEPPIKEKLPTTEELEAEWKQRIRDAERKEERILDGGTKKPKQDQSLEQVFERLKEVEPTTPRAEEARGGERLDRIRGVISGEVPEIKERELTGAKIPGLYKIFPIGQIPPLNLLSKAFFNSKGGALETSLEVSNIPLYSAEYASFSVAVGFISSLIFFLFFLILTSFEIVLSILVLFVSLIIISLFVLVYPNLRTKSTSRDIDKQLPFALRHMSALLGAGISIFDSIVSVSKAEYGALSYELDHVVWNVKSGQSLSDALEDSTMRVDSKAFNRVVVHIRRALQMGGDVAQIISQIAEDLTFEMRMKISDFVEKLNAFAVVYIIGGIVGPVVVSIFSVVGSIPIVSGGRADPVFIMLLLLLVFPLVMAMIVYVIKAMEPRV
jgi:flagellar protein FlaJ